MIQITMKRTILRFTMCSVRSLRLLSDFRSRFALLVGLGFLSTTIGCMTPYKVQPSDVGSFVRAKGAFTDVTNGVQHAKKPRAQGGGEVLGLQELLVKSQVAISGFLATNQIRSRDIEPFKSSLIIYRDEVTNFVKAAVADRNNYSINREIEQQLAAQASRVGEGIDKILTNVKNYEDVQFEKLLQRIRLSMKTLGDALLAVDKTVLMKLDENRKKQWINAATNWLQLTASGLNALAGEVKADIIDVEQLSKALRASLGRDLDPWLDFGLRTAMNVVNSFLHPGPLDERGTRKLEVIRVEFDNIVKRYNEAHPSDRVMNTNPTLAESTAKEPSTGEKHQSTKGFLRSMLGLRP